MTPKLMTAIQGAKLEGTRPHNERPTRLHIGIPDASRINGKRDKPESSGCCRWQMSTSGSCSQLAGTWHKTASCAASLNCQFLPGLVSSSFSFTQPFDLFSSSGPFHREPYEAFQACNVSTAIAYSRRAEWCL